MIDPLSYVLVDNCCEERNFYQTIFGDMPVKLDVWYGIKRIFHDIPKSFPWRLKFSQALELIVRQEVGVSYLFWVNDINLGLLGFLKLRNLKALNVLDIFSPSCIRLLIEIFLYHYAFSRSSAYPFTLQFINLFFRVIMGLKGLKPQQILLLF